MMHRFEIETVLQGVELEKCQLLPLGQPLYLLMSILARFNRLAADNDNIRL